MKIRDVLAAASALALAGWLLPVPARAAGTLVISIAADPTGFDPEAVANNTSGFIMATVFDSLVRYKPGTTEVAPGSGQELGHLAGWSDLHVPPAHRHHIPRRHAVQRGGVHPDARSAAQEETIRTTIYNTGPVQGIRGLHLRYVASYSALDENTVQFKLKEPSAAFLNSLAMVWNGVVSYQAAAKYGKDFRNNPVGTGPFIFREWKSRDQIVLDANPNYWKGKPKIDASCSRNIRTRRRRCWRCKRGETQIMGDVATQVIPALRADHNIVVLTQPGLTVNGMAMPNDTPPFNDKRVRQALNYAVDKEAINKALYGGPRGDDDVAAAGGAVGLRQVAEGLSV